MSPPDRPDCIQIAFDDHCPVANADLILPVTLAHQLRLVELVDRHVDLGDGPVSRAKMVPACPLPRSTC